MYIHIHWHSHYSLLEAIGKVSKVLDKAKEYGYPAIGITDYHGMYGIMEFYTKAKKADIKPICGIELTLSFQLGKRPDQDQFVVLIAKNFEGYQHLMKLTTIANTMGMNGIPTTDFTTLEAHAGGLICILGGKRGILNTRLQNGLESSKLKEQIRRFQTIFGADLYMEVIAQDYALEPTLRWINSQTLTWAEEFGIPVIASTNFHYISDKDKQAFEVALAIKDQRQITDPARRTVKGNYYIMKEQEVEEILKHNGYSDAQIQTRFATNQALADGVNLQLPKPTAKFPTYQSPKKFVELYENVKGSLVQEN